MIVALLGWGCGSEPAGWTPDVPARPPLSAVPRPLDRDGDGFSDDEDCGPNDRTRYPGAPEQCNGLDDDCDGSVDPEADEDADGDGSPWCLDCNDQDATFRPGGPDALGDGSDQDCDGTDGQGLAVPAPTWAGVDVGGLHGFSLGSGDFDGDGCADLAIGQPRDLSDLSEVDLVALRAGCEGAVAVFGPPQGGLFGYTVAVTFGTVVVHEPLYRGNAGRIRVFDSSFGPGATARLDIIGGYNMAALHSMVLLDAPAEWVMFAGVRQDRQLVFNLVLLSRGGEIHFDDAVPDWAVVTDSSTPLGSNQIADVGDRDGDGSVDLALPVTVAEESVYFFGEVGPLGVAHTADAPEVWRDAPEQYAGWFMGGGGDLDGDGLDDALVGSALGDGTAPGAGRVYVTPWLGPGERWLEADAPARIEGESSSDYTGEAMAVGDLDGDGADDLVVGAPGDFNTDEAHGKVLVFLGPLAGVSDRYDAARVYVGQTPGDHLGASVALGDFDGSGRLDLAMGAPFADGADSNTGQVHLLADPL